MYDIALRIDQYNAKIYFFKGYLLLNCYRKCFENSGLIERGN